MTIYLRSFVTEAPDLIGFDFYLYAGDAFDIDEFAELYDLNRNVIHERDIRTTIARAHSLATGQWMKVEYHDEL